MRMCKEHHLGRCRTESQADLPREDGRRSRKAEGRQHACGRRQPGARRRKYTKQECRDKGQTL